MSRTYDRVVLNLIATQTRRERLEGRNYLVVPTVMLTVGVHNGSQGALFYPPEELSRNPVVWNHKPIVVYHPTLNGEGISACDPTILERQKVGIILNTAYDGRLRNESWLDEEKLRLVDDRVYQAIQNGKTVEVSTGLFHDPEPMPGEWQGKKYDAIVRYIQPDHLAILPDQVGACSIADGAGLLRNTDHGLSHNEIQDHLHEHLNGHKDPWESHKSYSEVSHIRDVFPKHVVYEKGGKHYKHGYKVKSGKAQLDGEPEEVTKQTNYVTANGLIVGRNEEHQGPIRLPQPHVDELSEPMRKQQMQRALEEHYSGITQEGDWGGWVTDLFANYVVWSKDNKLFRLPYTYDDDKIRFDGEPEEVERVSDYRARRQTPIDGTTSPYNVNQQGSNMPAARQAQNTMHQGAHSLLHDATQYSDAHHPSGDKSDSQVRSMAGGARSQQVDHLIKHGGWGEEDRKFLSDLPDDHFERVSKYSLKGATQPIVPYSYEGIGDRSSVGSAMPAAHNQRGVGQLSIEEYINQAPPGMRDVLQNAMTTHTQEKQRLVRAILANQSNCFSEKWLMALDMPQLRGIAALAGGPVSNISYAGQAEIPMFIENKDRLGQVDEELPVLPLPVMDFKKERAS